jgi:hypothetical protein
MPNATKGLTHMRRWVLGLHARPWLRGAVLLWLFAGILVVSFHQHHGAAAGHDCALCAAAQTPVIVSHSSIQLSAPEPSEPVVALTSERDVAVAFRTAFPSRAPPLA